MKKKIIIVSGDPTSVNSEIIFKSWKKIKNSIKKKIYIISNHKLLHSQFKELGYSIEMVKVNTLNDNLNTNKLKILNMNLNFKKAFKIKERDASKFVLDSLNYAHNLALKKNVAGIINCPLNKKLLNKNKIGVTEFLASKCQIKNNSEVMLIRNKKLSVCPITTHINLKEVAKKINKKIIINKVKIINAWFKKINNKKPRIGILGLNPHSAEFRIDSEEKKIIIPAVLKLKKLNINIKGPLAADTVFINNYKKFDIIVGMYHDQVLSPFKTIFKFNAINITLGLKYLRMSPDHGVAVDLIGKNKADPISLIECINFVNKIAK